MSSDQPAAPTSDPSERILWRLVKYRRLATAIAHAHPEGDEVQVLVGGELHASRLFHDDPDGLEAFSARLRDELVADGWAE